MTTFEQRYRRKAGEPASVPVPQAESTAIEMLQAAASAAEEYKAYNLTAHPELELWIRTNNLNDWADVYLPYSYRHHMISDGNGFYISMHYGTPVTCVVIHGRNLQELAHKLSKREIEWIMEYDVHKWLEVPEGAPCITAIEISHAPRPTNGRDDADTEGEERPSMATH